MFGIKNIREQSFQEIVEHIHVFMPSHPYKKLQFLIGDTFYYFNQKCGDFFDRIGNVCLKRMYICRSSVLNID